MQDCYWVRCGACAHNRRNKIAFYNGRMATVKRFVRLEFSLFSTISSGSITPGQIPIKVDTFKGQFSARNQLQHSDLQYQQFRQIIRRSCHRNGEHVRSLDKFGNFIINSKGKIFRNKKHYRIFV